MADPFIGEIRTFGFDFAPRQWAHCDGQAIPLVQNTTLFALLGNTYGGDLKTKFMLPDLRGRTPLGRGFANGSEFKQGEAGSFVSAETASAPVDEKSFGTLGVNFCIALQGVWPPRW